MRNPRTPQILSVGSGTVQGLVQSTAALLLMWFSGKMERQTLTLGWVVAAIAVVLLFATIGVTVDRRRSGAPLALVAPMRVRGVLLVVAFALFAVLIAMDGHARVLSGAIAVVPWTWMMLDRVVGPAWVLVGHLRDHFARRGWHRCQTLESDATHALVVNESGARMRLRVDAPLEATTVFVELVLHSAGDPYRDTDIALGIVRFETLAERGARRHDAGTAALALISGLLWFALPLCILLGRSLGAPAPIR